MRMRTAMQLASAVLLAVTLVGCFNWKGARPIRYLYEADELTHYKDKVTDIDYPCVDQPPAPEAVVTDSPRTILDRRKDEIWDMPLVEAMHIAMANSTVIRTDAAFLSTGNPLYTNPNNVASTFDPAIQETGVLFGNRGVEAALSDFDAQFTTSMIWGRDERVQNSAFTGGAIGFTPGDTLVQETGAFDARLQKQFAYGGTFGLNKEWNYLGTNSRGVLFPSSYTGTLSADYRHPLWAGSGADYTRIAGPLNPNFGGITGVSQGVLIARINSDITIADFEANVRNMIRDVEAIYWELYLAYRRYDTAVTARNSALRTWQEEQIRRNVGRGDPVDELQAREAYFTARSAAETALGDIYTVETRLRRLIGLSVNDGKVIRPCDEPVSAEFSPDWYISLTEALTNRVELRRQKWQIKSLQLQLHAAKSLTNPRLDFVSAYRVNGFGDDLFGESDNDSDGTPQGLNSAYETMTQGDQTGWNLGFEFSMPIGFRSAKAQVRNIELRLAKAREVLATQELEISHELAVAYQDLTTNYVTAQTNFNRLRAAEQRVGLLEVRERVGTITTDLVLRALSDRADAEVAYYTSLVQYNQAIANLQFRKGTLLEFNNIHLAEGSWTPQAHEQALERAWARTNAFTNPLLESAPPEFEAPLGPGHAPRHPALAPPLQPTPVDDGAMTAPPPVPSDAPEEKVPMRNGRDRSLDDDAPATPQEPDPFRPSSSARRTTATTDRSSGLPERQASFRRFPTERHVAAPAPQEAPKRASRNWWSWMPVGHESDASPSTGY